MNSISIKRATLCMRHLGYIPQRALTKEERIKCGLAAGAGPRAKAGKKRRTENPWLKLFPVSAPGAGNQTDGSCTTAGDSNTAPPDASMPTSLILGGTLFSDPRSYRTKLGRVRAKGEDMTTLRLAAYLRSGARCERVHLVMVDDVHVHQRCNKVAPLSGSVFRRGHLSHLRHGSQKSDVLSEVEFWCAACHLASHGPQWDPRKVKPMSDKQFVSYYAGDVCFCEAAKAERSAMCHGCRDTLADTQSALLHVIDTGDGCALLKSLAEFWAIVKSVLN